MTPRLIALIGRAGAGKTTLAEILATRYGFDRLSLAEPLKAFVQPKDRSVEERTRLIRTGDKLLEAFGRYLFVDMLALRFIEKRTPVGVIDDVRMLHEVERLIWWSRIQGIHLTFWYITVSEEELRRRRGRDYVPPDFPMEDVKACVRAVLNAGMGCGTIAKPVLELTDSELELIANTLAFD